MLLRILTIYFSLQTVLLAGLFFAPDKHNYFIVISLTLIILALVSLIVLSRMQTERQLLNILDIFFKQSENSLIGIGKSKSVNILSRELAQCMAREFGFSEVSLLVRKKGTFVPNLSIGISQKEIKNLKIPVKSKLIQQLAHQNIIHLDQLYNENNDANPFNKYSLKYIIAVTNKGKISHLYALSDSNLAEFGMIKPFLQIMADQIGIFKFYEDSKDVFKQKMSKVKNSQNQLKKEFDELKKQGSSDSKSIITAQDHLLNIFDRDQLYEALLKLLSEQFLIDRICILVNPQDSGKYSIGYKQGFPNADKVECPTIDAKNISLQELSKKLVMTPIVDMAKFKIDENILKRFIDSGLEVATLIPDHNKRGPMIFIGRKKKAFTENELNAIYSICRVFGLVLENFRHFKKIEELSYTDEMTSLYNYRFFYKRLSEETIRAKRFNRHLALVIFDVDEFKIFNDTYGHQSGDFLLKQLGKLLLESVRSIDVVSRYGGEEFCVIMPETDIEKCQNFMERLRMIIFNYEFADRFSDKKHKITVSLGGAIYPNDAQRVDRLIYCADMSLLQAKGSGRNKSCMYNEKLVTR